MKCIVVNNCLFVYIFISSRDFLSYYLRHDDDTQIYTPEQHLSDQWCTQYTTDAFIYPFIYCIYPFFFLRFPEYLSKQKNEVSSEIVFQLFVVFLSMPSRVGK